LIYSTFALPAFPPPTSFAQNALDDAPRLVRADRGLLHGNPKRTRRRLQLDGPDPAQSPDWRQPLQPAHVGHPPCQVHPGHRLTQEPAVRLEGGRQHRDPEHRDRQPHQAGVRRLGGLQVRLQLRHGARAQPTRPAHARAVCRAHSRRDRDH